MSTLRAVSPAISPSTTGVCPASLSSVIVSSSSSREIFELPISAAEFEVEPQLDTTTARLTKVDVKRRKLFVLLFFIALTLVPLLRQVLV